MRPCKALALLLLLMCVVSCSGEASKEQKHIAAGADLVSKASDTITGRYYAIGKKQGKPSTLKVLHIKSFTVDRVVYDLVEYEFNPKPSDVEAMGMLGSVSVSDPNPQGTIQRRQDRLPKPYAVTGIKGIPQRGVEAPLTMEKPKENALSCYRYTALTPQQLTFEFCENGYRGINPGEFRHQGDYESKSVVSEWESVVTEILAANPGFPDTAPVANSGKSATASRKLEPQNVVTDIRYDGEVIGRAAVCLDNKGLLSQEEGNKIGAAYLNWLTMTYGREDAAPFFYILKEALTVGEKAQQKAGMADCDQRIAAFDELAKVIGYQRPTVFPRK